MAELFTAEELQQHLRDEVAAVGGARKWLRKHPRLSLKHVEHMVTNGDAATLPEVREVLGFREVRRFEPIVKQRKTSE